MASLQLLVNPSFLAYTAAHTMVDVARMQEIRNIRRIRSITEREVSLRQKAGTSSKKYHIASEFR